MLQTFVNPIQDDYTAFGDSVASVGGNVIVGAPRESSAASYGGTAYLFDGSTGTLLQTFVNPDPAYCDFFGGSVAAVGNNVLIGAPEISFWYGGDGGSEYTGKAYLFDSTTGTLLRTFLNPNKKSGSAFGCSVAAVGNNVLVGAPSDDSGAEYAGAAYLFDGSTGNLLETFVNPTPAEHDYFGDSVAAMGNNILVAATGATNGTVYLLDGSLPGDVDGDGFVGPEDLSIVITYWGQSGLGREYGDLNENGVVDGSDYSEVISYWNPPPTEPPFDIPEPATLGLLLVAGLALLRTRNRTLS